MKLPRSEVDVVPAQGEQLAAAKAGGQRQDVQGFQPLAVDHFEQALGLGQVQAQAALGVSVTDPARYRWELVSPGDPDYMDHGRRLLHAVADRARWLAALKEARQRANLPGSDAPAGKEAA